MKFTGLFHKITQEGFSAQICNEYKTFFSIDTWFSKNVFHFRNLNGIDQCTFSFENK
jgi:hypothetical protein